MDLLFIELIALIIVLILLLITRVIRLRKNGRIEPVTKTEQEVQYQLLLQEIESLEEACKQRTASRKLRNKLALKQAQADKLQTLIMKSVISDVPASYEPDPPKDIRKFHKPQTGGHNTIYLCPKCRRQVFVDDKFCANCGFRLQSKRQI
jgi:predicted RNA-binding Zn-ribbon protein involved in translation (DUF1610 family)